MKTKFRIWFENNSGLIEFFGGYGLAIVICVYLYLEMSV